MRMMQAKYGCRQRYVDPLLSAAEGGLLGSVEFAVIVYQTRSPFRYVAAAADTSSNILSCEA